MNKEIKYGGFSANPNDHDGLEGDLAVAMNLIPEDGTIKPVLPPGPVLSGPVPYGYTIMCIHDNNFTDGKHYICWCVNNSLYKMNENGTFAYDGGIIHYFGPDVTVSKVEPVGNTLVVLASDGMHYILWKNGDYTYLGNHLPELDLSFSLLQANIYDTTSDEYEVSLPHGTTMAAIRADKELTHKICQAIMAAANQVTAKIQSKKKFSFPFFVRYAFRLYDGSLTMHSAPILLVPTRNAPTIDMGWTIEHGQSTRITSDAHIKATLKGYDLFHNALDSTQLDEVSRWRDIITGVDVFISRQFYTYDQAAKDEDINFVGRTVLPDKKIAGEIIDNGNFFFIKHIPVDNIFFGSVTPGTGTNRPSEARPRANTSASGIIDLDFEPNNDNIVVRELMTDDYDSHDRLLASRAFAYNNRINLAGLSKCLFSGFNPSCLFFAIGNESALSTTHTVVIETDGREISMRSQQGVVAYDSNRTLLWYYYPNINAKRVYVDTGETSRLYYLTPHTQLNGAYYCALDEDAAQPMDGAAPSDSQLSSEDDCIVPLPNKIYTSEVNNPFYFPLLGINSISTGNILGICSAVRPVSTSQFGYADLYIFADNGIWVAKINEAGTYSNITLATGDVCLDADSITQLETSVLFVTARGIMLISGSQAQCISQAIDDEGMAVESMNKHVNKMAGLLNLGDISIAPFRDFLHGCRMIYDYRGQRIIVYNPGYSYAYIYSLESNKWGMMESDIDYSVKAYPDALAVLKGDIDGVKLVNYSEIGETGETAQLLVTRPLTLDQPDILKTVNTVLQRGLFRKHQGHVQSVIYGSRDLFNWQLVSSSTDEALRGRRGTPYKWFRVALLLRLPAGESITGCSIDFDPRYTNRLR